MHLSLHEIEDILAGDSPVPSHGNYCPKCRRKLSELRAIRAKLRHAFARIVIPKARVYRLLRLLEFLTSNNKGL